MVRSVAKPSKKSSRSGAQICEHMTFAGKEAFKRLRTNVMIALEGDAVEPEEKKCHVVGVTSAQPSEGKSTVSINLAFVMAELGKSVLLIDGDLRRPSIHTVVGERLSPGLSEVLMGQEALKNAIIGYHSEGDDTKFDMILSGDYPDKPSELLNSARFRKLIEVVSGVYDYVLIDLPPVNAVADAINVSKCTDGLIVVIRESHCPRGVLMNCVDQLKFAKANILGFVMNGCVGGSKKRYYNQKYYYNQQNYYYYGKYGK